MERQTITPLNGKTRKKYAESVKNTHLIFIIIHCFTVDYFFVQEVQ